MEGLFALGSNGSGQLGIGHKEDVSVPKPVLFERHSLPRDADGDGDDDDDGIVKISAGGNHTILVTKRGRAYWSGDPSTGACGIVASAAVSNVPPVFREVVLSKAGTGTGTGTETDTEPLTGPVADVACTWDSSVFVLRDAEGKATKVYICGGGGGGGGRGGEAIPLEEVAGFPPPGSEVRDLAAGFRHAVAVLDNGDVYGWGHGRKGQLGVAVSNNNNNDNDNKGMVDHPTKIQGIGFPVARAVCCQHATCLIAEPGDGQVLVLGADKWALKSAAPAAVPNWKSIGASWGAVYVLRYDGVLEAWGRDDHGQLPPPGVPRVESVAAGSEHVVALTDAGDVISWGWGEHGNCGPRETSEKTEGGRSGAGDVKGRWNTVASLKNLPEGSEITLVGAGCATSWIQIAADGIFL